MGVDQLAPGALSGIGSGIYSDSQANVQIDQSGALTQRSGYQVAAEAFWHKHVEEKRLKDFMDKCEELTKEKQCLNSLNQK
jgi:hypothetical protein